MQMWARPRGVAPDALFALMCGDLSAPVTFAVERTGWAPTIQLTAFLRGLPADGWLRVMCTCMEIGHDWFDEDHIVVDSLGRIVVQSRQLAMVPAPRSARSDAGLSAMLSGMARIAIIGGGSIGEALLSGLLRAGRQVKDLVVAERMPERAKYLADTYSVLVTIGDRRRGERDVRRRRGEARRRRVGDGGARPARPAQPRATAPSRCSSPSRPGSRSPTSSPSCRPERRWSGRCRTRRRWWARG